ncbi:hypothetical protein OK671_08930, partial [Streptococcus pneumoniae]|nr:hypothetical protein [Streptococcus pneumoniae]MDG8104808.1 hypothetical protein [Streptococcus pneumoniae]
PLGEKRNHPGSKLRQGFWMVFRLGVHNWGLGSVCQILGKGGIITYSTCTIVSEENFQVVKAFLESHPEFEQVKLEHECKDIMKDGCILITPELYGSDGFFISQFRKISD